MNFWECFNLVVMKIDFRCNIWNTKLLKVLKFKRF